MNTQPTHATSGPRAIAPQHPQRTCHQLGVCQHPTTACTGSRCAIAMPTAPRRDPAPAPVPPLPPLPFGIEGPHHSAPTRGQRINDALASALLLGLGAVGGYKLGQWVLMALGV